jgi:AcrR family transcriptional regulator
MPRGTAMPTAREQLFDATDRLLRRDGPTGITTRAITDEAGVAKGILHNHFGDLDTFLAAYIGDRISRLAEQAQALPALAGQQTLIDNLTTAMVDLFGSGAATLAALMAARPSLQAQIGKTPSGSESVFDELTRAIAAYLIAEQQLGRVTATDAEAETLAFTLVGATHHLFFSRGLEPVDPNDVKRIVAGLLGSHTTPDQRRAHTATRKPAGRS